MDLEIKFLNENSPGENPKLLMDHVQRMVSGEAPFLPATLSRIYGALARKVLAPPIPFGSNITSNIDPSHKVSLICPQCYQTASRGSLCGGLCCPRCPRRNRKRGRPHMECPLCNTTRVSRDKSCSGRGCEAVFL